jgi:hypothetical protein
VPLYYLVIFIYVSDVVESVHIDEGEVAPPPLKKAKTGSKKEVTAEVEGRTLPEGAPVAPPPPKMQRKRKEAPSIASSPHSTPGGHVSVVAFFFLFTMVLTRVAPEPTFGCSQPIVGLMDV